VPLDAGGGTRLKILEAFAAGVPVVSTAIGMEGIAARSGEHFVEAERAGFADAILRLWQAPERARALAAAARLVAGTYEWAAIGRRAATFVAEIVVSGQPTAAR
jgi:glycosyltransferase involved in cell wall biosynthesis